MKPTTERQKSILGTLALRPGLFIEVSDILASAMFPGLLADLAAAIWEKQEAGQGYSRAILLDRCKEEVYHECVDLFDPKNLTENARAVADAYLAGKEVELMEEAIRAIRSGENYWETTQRLQSSREILLSTRQEPEDRGEVIRQVIDDVFTGNVNTTPTGFPEFQDFTLGWHPGHLLILAARPGMGKTTMALEFCLRVAEQGQSAAFFSFEMTKGQLFKKFASQIAGISLKRMLRHPAASQSERLNREEEKAVRDALEKLYDLPIYVIDNKSCAPRDGAIRDHVRRLREKEGIRFAAVDYLQLLRPDQELNDSTRDTGRVTKSLKRTSVLYDVPLLCLSQLNRGLESRADKRPLMSDIRNSGEVEEDADEIYSLYRPWYYNIQEDAEGYSTKGITDMDCLKHRLFGEELPRRFRFKFRNGKITQFDPDNDLPPLNDTDPFDDRPANMAIPAGSRGGKDEDLPF